MTATWTRPRSWPGGTLVTAAILNTHIRDNMDYLNAALPKVGMVAAWGQAGALPTNWSEDTTLRDVFVYGAGGSYAVGDTGGAATSDALAAHSSHTATQMSAHATHSIPSSSDYIADHLIATTGRSGSTVTSKTNISAHTGMALNAHSAHSGMSVNAHAVHGTMSLLPTYHALTRMKLGSPATSFTTPRTWVTGEVPSATNFNTDIRDNLSHLYGRALPKGTIHYWSGTIASIPSTHYNCNGSNETPDLQDKFIIGAGGSYSVGATGGSNSRTLPTHASHTLTLPSAHASHTVTQPSAHTGTASGHPNTGYSTVNAITSFTHTGFAADAHSAHSGGSVSGAHTHDDLGLMPYRALATIMHGQDNEEELTRTWVTDDIVTSTRLSVFLKTMLENLKKHEVPVGSIVEWGESVASIPSNYNLCDGTGGSIDLRGKMVVGVGSTFSYGASGGNESGTPAAHGTHTLSGIGTHSAHTLTKPDAHTTTHIDSQSPFESYVLNSRNHDVVSPGYSPPHDAHSGLGGGFSSHSAHSSLAIIPPFKAYAFMQRIT